MNITRYTPIFGILAALVTPLLWPAPSLADESSPQAEASPDDPGPPAPPPTDPKVSPTDPKADADTAEVSDEDAIFLSPEITGHEVIEIWEERPEKPFDRDTEVRITGVELVERGATNLAEALSLVPEISLRMAGRGGQQIDIRGGRKGSIKVLIDGVAVSDPFYGNFDISSIPVTDIVQIRVSSSPSSPIDGVGGPAGVIEVHTRDAVGAAMVEARALGSSLPEGWVSATGRSPLGEHWAIRPSASMTLGSREFEFVAAGLDEDRFAANGALRLEYRKAKRRVVADLWAQRRSFVVPPGEEGSSDILFIDGETAGRAGVTADDQVGAWRLQGHASVYAFSRQSNYFEPDCPDFNSPDCMTTSEDLSANRIGVSVLANRPVRKDTHIIGAAVFSSDKADVNGFDDNQIQGRSSVIEPSAAVQWERGPVQVHAATGAALPIGIDADPWPEFKLTASYRAAGLVTFEATGARKGRLPTLRERFRLDVGNEDLSPEQATFGELAVIIDSRSWFEFKSSAYVRDTSGLIKFDRELDALGNLDDTVIRGVDSRVRIHVLDSLSTGASWSFTDAYAEDKGIDPLDFLPRHRADLWLAGKRDDRLGATLRIRLIGERLDRGSTLPAYQLVELSAFARLGRGLMGNLRVDNMLGEQYELRSGGVLGPGRVFTLSLHGQWQ